MSREMTKEERLRAIAQSFRGGKPVVQEQRPQGFGAQPDITPDQQAQLEAVRARYKEGSQQLVSPEEQAEIDANEAEAQQMKQNALRRMRGY